ncbi:hypothetical protein [uncultured Sulfitobacter sp.]|uniref:hypothetical protein n=1 Tax=uncultured Sulfitobacter sp. TaxID=191468 RepID=UPI00262DCE06|nr:hypothetical protein [uncultured Sulfitobacter sp.]
MTKKLAAASALALTLALTLVRPAAADPAVGFGLSLTFGGGEVDAGVGVGVRLFSDDDEDSFAATLGLDYMLKSRSMRPTVGAAYLMDDSYIGLDMGLDLQSREFDFGVGIGGVKTEGDDAAAPVGTGDFGGPNEVF